MEGSNSSRRLSIDEQHMAANLPAEQAKDEEIVARSGDPGMLDFYQASDPWSTGEIEHLETKWLQKELRDRSVRETGSFHSSSVRMASLERMGSMTSARFSHARSSRSSRRNSTDQQIFEIGQTSGNAASSTSQMGSLENEPERVSSNPAIAHSPLSDSPLFPKSALREPFEGLAPQSSRRVSIDEQHMAANSPAEQAKDEEIVARSGDPGMLDFYQASDPWSTGEIEHLERKWLQKELRDRAARDTGSFRSSSVRMASLERMGSATSARFSHARSSRSSRRSSADQQIFEIGQTSGNAASSTSQMASLENEPERVSPDPATAHSPLSDSPLFPKSALREPFEGLAPQLSAAHLRPRDRPTKEDRCHHSLEYIGTLAHLACFGIIGVLIRYGLEVLFADVLSITREGTIIYRDLPANVVGSFFMGWVGIVLKKDILFFSEPLAIGLSTGLMGSITTYAAWNQKMVDLLTTGNIVAALSGLILGMAIAQLSLLAGIDSAKGLKWAIGKLQRHRVQNEVTENELKGICRLSPDNSRRRMVSFMVFAFTTACLWGAALALLIKGGSPQNVRILWLACIVAPPGVWSRWHLARFNGKGLGGRLKWLPVGTLLANLLAATLEAVLTFLQLVVTDDGAPLLIGGLQLGFLGCLSTVSTFVAEVYTMHVGPMKPKGYAYTFTTLVLGLALGIMLYSCPAWTKGYAKW